QWLTRHKQVAEALGVALGTVLAAALVVATANMVAFTASLITNPIFLIVAAIALLGVGIYELVTHWKQVWGDIKQWALDAWTFLDSKVFQPIGNFFVSVWQGFLNTAKNTWDTVWGSMRNTVEAAWSFIWNVVLLPLRIEFVLIGDALHVMETVFDTVWKAIRTVVETVWNWLEPTVIKPLLDYFINQLTE